MFEDTKRVIIIRNSKKEGQTVQRPKDKGHRTNNDLKQQYTET
jgi:hypothetical protein